MKPTTEAIALQTPTDVSVPRLEPLTPPIATADVLPVPPASPTEVPLLATVMQELSSIHEILVKRHKKAMVSLQTRATGGFHIRVNYEKTEEHTASYVSRPIHDTITIKGLNWILDEIKAAVGI